MTPRIARARTPSRAGRCRPDTARGACPESTIPLGAAAFDSSSLDTGKGYLCSKTIRRRQAWPDLRARKTQGLRRARTDLNVVGVSRQAIRTGDDAMFPRTNFVALGAWMCDRVSAADQDELT